MTPRPDHGELSYRGSGRLAGRKALVTGGDSGVGRAAAIAFAREGADVAINYLPAEEPDAREVLELVRAERRRAVAIPGDLRSESFCRRLADRATESLGGLDILVNNAARQIARKSIEEITSSDFDDTFKVNLYADGGRVAIVTGGSRGIGAAIAERLARDGLTVAVNYSRGEDKSRALVGKIENAGGRAIAVQADVSDPAAVAAMFNEVERAFGGVDVLVNNAGLMDLAPVADTDDALFDRTIAINIKGVFNGLREAARRLKDGGRIVSLSSSLVGLYQPTYAAYAATKAGVEAMSRILSKELGPRKITVNVVAPGPVATDLFLNDKDDEDIAPIVERTPLGRLGEPEDVACVVSFLVGPDGAWINGQVLRANGGII